MAILITLESILLLMKSSDANKQKQKIMVENIYWKKVDIVWNYGIIFLTLFFLLSFL